MTIGELKRKLDALLAENPGWETQDVEVRSRTARSTADHSTRYSTTGADIEYRHRSFVVWIEK